MTNGLCITKLESIKIESTINIGFKASHSVTMELPSSSLCSFTTDFVFISKCEIFTRYLTNACIYLSKNIVAYLSLNSEIISFSKLLIVLITHVKEFKTGLEEQRSGPKARWPEELELSGAMCHFLQKCPNYLMPSVQIKS